MKGGLNSMNNKLVGFPPRRNQFLFSPKLFKQRTIKLMYVPYTKIASFVWYLVRKFPLVRYILLVDKNKLPHEVVLFLSEYPDYDVQISIGTEGPEQKQTILLTSETDNLFIKLGTSVKAKQLIENECKVLQNLNGRFGSPVVRQYIQNDKFTALKTTYILASKFSSNQLDERLLAILVKISDFSMVSREDGIYAFNHGDFCPWNMLESNKKLHLIDWEMAGEYPLGYDLFTFIFQTNYLLNAALTDHQIIENNIHWIKSFYSNFDQNNYLFYLKKFAQLKYSQLFETKPDHLITTRYRNLINCR